MAERRKEMERQFLNSAVFFFLLELNAGSFMGMSLCVGFSLGARWE